MDHQIEQIKTAQLVPFANNARTHSPAQIKQIVASIKEFGFTNPVLVDKADGIIAGHGRVLAAKKLKMETVPCLRLPHLTEAQKRAYILADNKLALNAGWDDALLKAELEALISEGFNLDTIGFEKGELEALIGPLEKTFAADEDETPPVPETPVSVVGDIWILGKHRVMCGDSTSSADADLLMEGGKADLLFTDPPWNVNYGADDANGKYKTRTIMNDFMTPEKWAVFVQEFCESFYKFTKPGAPAYVVMSAQEWPAIDLGLRNAGFHWSSTIIWNKNTLVLSRKDYHTKYEPIWYGWNSSAPRLVQVSDRKQSDVWDIDRPTASDLHPTTKPVELIMRALENSSLPSGTVLDLFGGSGSTLIAAVKCDRICRTMELDPKYVDVIVKRFENFTGQKAVHAETGRTFEDEQKDRRKATI